MRASLDCYPCFFIQTLRTARIVTSDEKTILQILHEVSTTLPQIPFNVTPPEIGREVYSIISRRTGVKDPYKEVKDRCIREALSLYPELKRSVESSEDRLMTAIRLAIAGNVIDFGTDSSFDLTEELETILSQDFAVDNSQEFREALKHARNVLYLADNAGETVFDRLLIEEMDKPVIYVVREKPIINDATREDALSSGLDKVSEITSSGCDTPGTILKFCSDEFLETYRSANLIISKGQGNYEALSDEKRPIFFLLKAKCQVVARDLGVKNGSIILAKTGKL
ncbi:MAG: DUF89 family protein [Candidatus Aminicenantes bacterium]|jgi:uncharacterized protein with ATP-grasp and redox domains|nr:DUF89 family protein [Candidatus Aminicenantes bacterium]